MDALPGQEPVAAAWNQRILPTGTRRNAIFGSVSQPRDNNTLDVLRKGKQITFDEWADFFLENYSKPPIRAETTHEANETRLKTLQTDVWDDESLWTSIRPMIEDHLRTRLQQRKLRSPKGGDRANSGR